MEKGSADRPKSRELPAIVLYLAMIAGAFVVGVIIFNFVIMPGLTGKGDTVMVPFLEGMSLKQAADVCRKERLEFSVTGHRDSDDMPDGYVLMQDPRQGESMKRGRTVKVVLSSGPRMEIVPSFEGKTLRETEVLVESSGLADGRIVRIYSPGDGPPSVLATSPSTGTKVARGSAVDILVAMHGEPKAYLMPNLVGRDFPFVKDRLEKLGFNVVHAASRRGEGRFPNAIVSQSPAAGSKIKEGDTIELVVSTLE
ncbi:MAG: PASTA domain-containing protein [Candidatus Krumholzibacteria bacterium]|nr:PASTA domain-containing protein [Candidatus Krumholzibacteria bacterium]